MTRRPTLLVFTLGAEAERARRPLLPAEHGRTEVALRQGCLEAAVEAGREAGWRVVVSAPREVRRPEGVTLQRQEGEGFGDRLERACLAASRDPQAPVAHPGASPAQRTTTLAGENVTGRRSSPPAVSTASVDDIAVPIAPVDEVDDEVAGDGSPLVVVGTDVPGLGARHLRQAAAALEADPDCVVLGPSPDGGFYLLATARPLPGLASMTRWCRRDTLARLRRSLARAGRSTVLLEPLRDLDHRRDLERWMAQGHGPRRGRPESKPGNRPAGSQHGSIRHPAPHQEAPHPPAPDGHAPASRRHRPAGDGAAGAATRTAVFAAIWRSLLRHLARVLAALRQPASRVPIPAPRPAPVPVRSPRAPPLPSL